MMVSARPKHDTSTPGPDALVDALAQVTFLTAALLSKLAADNDLSMTQLRVLGILRDRQVRMSTLAAYLGLDKSSLTGLVDRAEKRGLVVRVANATDGRAVDVRLAPAGRRLAARLQDRSAQSFSTLTDKLSAAEQRRLQALLSRLVETGRPDAGGRPSDAPARLQR